MSHSRAQKDKDNHRRKLKRQTDKAWAHKQNAARKARRVKAPSGLMVNVPRDQRVKGFTTKRDAAGETLHEYTKTERASDDPPRFEPVPPNFAVDRITTFLDGQGQVRGQWVGADQKEVDRAALFEAALKEHVEQYRGLAEPTEAPRDCDQDLLALYCWGDPHIGLLAYGRETGGGDFDLKIGERELVRATDMLVDRAPAATLGVLLNIGDFFSIEDDSQLTPRSKHKQDTDGRFVKITRVGISIMRRSIDLMLKKHEQVKVVCVPGNHDEKGARMLAALLDAFYHNDERVDVVDNTNEFIYEKFGDNLLGFNHGLVANSAMPGIMAADCGAGGKPGCEAWWSACRYRYIFAGHDHHKTKLIMNPTEDQVGCTVERLRTLKARDSYEQGRGWRSMQSTQQVTFHKQWGERHRQVVNIFEVRDT